MLKVIVELHPNGRSSCKRTIGVINICNDGTGTLTRGNYIARISKQGQPNKESKTVEVKNFPRKSSGIWKLIKIVLEKTLTRGN